MGIENSPAAFKQILGRLLSSSAVTNEGDIVALLYLMDLIIEKAPAKALDVLHRFGPVVTNSRHSNRKRIWAIYLCGTQLLTVLHSSSLRNSLLLFYAS